MIFTNNTPQYLDFKPFTRLPDKLTHSQSYIPLQHMITVFGDPDKMVSDFEFRMAALSIWSFPFLKEVNPTAKRKRFTRR
jgi:hypothetical protein